VREVIAYIEEKDKRSRIMSEDPAKIHQGFVDKTMEELGIKTAEDVSKIKATEKDKVANLDKLESILEKAEEKGAATEEHIKLKAAISAHKATLTAGETSTTKPPGGDTSTGGGDTSTGGGDTSTGGGDTSTGGGTTTKPEDTPA